MMSFASMRLAKRELVFVLLATLAITEFSGFFPWTQSSVSESVTSSLAQTASKSLVLIDILKKERRREVRSLNQLAADPPTLTSELAWEHALNGEIFITCTNHHFSDFAISWAHNLKRAGVENYLIGALDLQAGEVLERTGLNWFAMFERGSNSTGLTKDNMAWGGLAFRRLGAQRLVLAIRFLSFGLNVTTLDSDSMFLRDPRPFFARTPSADMLVHTDGLHSLLAVGDEGLEDPEMHSTPLNIGCMVLRARPVVADFLRAWRKRLEADENVWDQAVFNELMHEGPAPKMDHKTRLLSAWHGRLRLGILPPASFSSGHAARVSYLARRQGVPQIMIHSTFLYGATPGKRHRLREARVWYDPPEYYQQPLLLSMDVRPPPVPAGFTDWPQERQAEMQLLHLKSMRTQLEQLRAGMALASALNRTVVLPELECLCDRYWSPMDRCRIPGAHQATLPFTCPFDHIFDPGVLYDDRPHTREWCPPIQIREYTFLTHPSYPIERADDVVVVGIPHDPAAARNASASANRLELPAGSKAGALVQALAPHVGVRRIHLADPLSLWGGFDDADAGAKFEARFNSSLAVMCCWSEEEPKPQHGTVHYREFLHRDPKYMDRVRAPDDTA